MAEADRSREIMPTASSEAAVRPEQQSGVAALAAALQSRPSVASAARLLVRFPGDRAPMVAFLQQHTGNGFTRKVLDAVETSSEVGLANDSLPFAGALLAPDRRDPKSPNFADDDGRTMSASATTTFTSEGTNRQVVVANQYEMLTEDGAQEDPLHHRRRADVLTNLVQFNVRHEVGPGLQFYGGIGVGAQTVGDLGGAQLQEWFHTNGGFGGRHLGQGLQDDYGRGGSTAGPAVSGGFGVRYGAGDPAGLSASVGANVEGIASFSPDGMSTAQATVSGRVAYNNIASLEISGTYSIAGPNSNYLKFAPIGAGALGASVRLQIDALRLAGIAASPFLMIQTNGAGFADTQYTIGVVIGSGSTPWLAPPK
ncbi:hypothetical protein BH11MYX1_BH11MYX1_05440 [soil metagenome]